MSLVDPLTLKRKRAWNEIKRTDGHGSFAHHFGCVSANIRLASCAVPATYNSTTLTLKQWEGRDDFESRMFCGPFNGTQR
ncbi:hypothetical protein OUZ56_000691 [Daphnia magna]|uniref:Uncharacterized protein n=1 Tax=Daphnia magna TaxID=35525 RepID=A0ABR0A0G3_9CRUS|nr:hypothetical protein OUZ56_000691 [Daphnia magna]